MCTKRAAKQEEQRMEKNSESAPEKSAPNRRVFGYAVIYGLGALIGAAMAIPAALYIFLPPKTRKPQAWTEAGDMSQLQPGTPQEMTFRRTHIDGWKIYSEKGTAWVVKSPEGKVLAFAPACTHLGCAYHWDAAKSGFLCPCHGSEFGIDGKVLAGPAPRPLDRFEVKVENARLWLGPVHQADETKL
jgi:menaquinol-cytochrome c reductase iron-sulfur subunit